MTDRFAQDRTFWYRMGRAVIVGFLGGLAALAFVRIVAIGTDLIWPEGIEYSFMGGSWWWVAVLGATGLMVGIMRVTLRVSDDLSGSLAILQNASVDRSTALQAIGQRQTANALAKQTHVPGAGLEPSPHQTTAGQIGPKRRKSRYR